jgi:hypothetical protein
LPVFGHVRCGVEDGTGGVSKGGASCAPLPVRHEAARRRVVTQELIQMKPFAANPTGPKHMSPRPPAPPAGLAFVEDLGWPMPVPPADRKPVRRPEMWVPGRHGDWLGTIPTMQ